MHLKWRYGLLVALLLAMAGAPIAQVGVTTNDIERLQDGVSQAESEIARLRGRDATLAGRLQSELDQVREEVTYLRVKLRKDGSVTRAEYGELRDRLDDLRARARGDRAATTTQTPSTSSPTTPTSSSASRPASQNEIPVGTEVDVRLQTLLSSGTAQVEDRFETTTLADLYSGERLLVPAGSVMRGVVSSVDKATRTDRKGSLTVSFDQLTVRGRSYPIRATVTQALESEGIKGEAARIGTGAGVGAIIGGILGGFKGALAGILIGAGGTIAATEGKDVELPAGTVLRVRFDSPVTIRSS